MLKHLFKRTSSSSTIGVLQLTSVLVLVSVAGWFVATPDTATGPTFPCRGQSLNEAQIANANGLSLTQLHRLGAERSLTPADVCALPATQLKRAVEKLDSSERPDLPDEAVRYRLLDLKDENGFIPPNGLVRAKAQMEQMRQAADPLAAPVVAGVAPGSWTWLGPGNVGGRLRAILIHPSSPDTMWVGSVGGGIWKTINGGTTWSPVDDFMANLAVTSLVMNPTNSSVLYAGTGEGFFNADAIRGAGIFKSTDGGTTWSQLASTANSNFYSVNRLAVSPAGTVLLAATGVGIYRSTDAGSTWTQVLGIRTLDVDFDPSDGMKAIAGLASGKPYYSTDSGLTWSQSTAPTSTGRVEVAYAPSSPGMTYASVESSNGVLLKSTDGGVTYSQVNSGTNYLGTQGWYDNALWVSPTDPGFVIVGGIDLWRSTDGGVTLTKMSNWTRGGGGAGTGSAHADQHVVVAHPGYDGTSNRTVFFGNDGGIFKTVDVTTAGSSPNQDNGWTSLNNGLGVTQFYGAAGNPASGKIVGGTQDNGTPVYSPAGGANGWTFMFGGDGGWSAADPGDPNYLYGEYVYLQIHRSTNGGTSSSYIYSGITDAGNCANFIAPFILDPNNPNTLLAGGCSLWRSVNAKAAPPVWQAIKAPASGNSPISAIAVAPGNSDVVWVGHNNGDVYRTANGTSPSPNWVRIDLGTPALPNRKVTRIAIDPTNTDLAYVAFGGFSADNLYATVDGGFNWVDRTGSGVTGLPDIPLRAIVLHPDNSQWLYVGGESGIFASEDGGATWHLPHDGPANVSVDELFFMGTGNREIVAATHGRGLYKQATISAPQTVALAFTAPATTIAESGSITASVKLTTSDGNPTAGGVTVRYATQNGTATAPQDYAAVNGIFTFPAGSVNNSAQSFTVAISSDLLNEVNETFELVLSAPSGAGAVLGTALHTVTITDDDAAPSLVMADVTVAEPGSGSANAVFQVSLSAPSGKSVSVDYATADGTATGALGSIVSYSNPALVTINSTSTPQAASPYPSTITVPALPGLVGKVTVTLTNFSHTWPRDVDVLLVGPTGQSVVLMSDAGGSSPGVSNRTLTFDDGAPSSLSTSAPATGTYRPTNLSDGEGSDTFVSPAPPAPYGSTLSVFNGTLAAGAWRLYVMDDTAIDSGQIGGWSLSLQMATGDYVPRAGTVTLQPGATNVSLSVPVLPDSAVEGAENFFLNFTNATNADLPDNQAQATITDVVFPTLSIADVTVAEPNSGSANAVFNLSLSAPTTKPVTLNYATIDGTATSAAGPTVAYFNPAFIAINSTSTPQAASPYPSTITVPPVSGVISSMSVTLQGFSHSRPQDVDVMLVGPGGQRVLLMSDVGGTGAVASQNLTFIDQGSDLTDTSVVSGVYRPTNLDDAQGGDAFPSPAPSGATATTLSAFYSSSPSGTWQLYVSDDTGGSTGSIQRWDLAFQMAGGDYAPRSGSLTISPGSTSATVAVPVLPDAIVEGSEYFFLNLSGVTGASVPDAHGQATIGAPSGTFTTLTSSVNPSAVGQSVVLTSRVRAAQGTPTGSVAFKDAGVTMAGGTVAIDGSGVASYTTTTLTAGSHTLSAVYSGDSSFSPSTGSILQQVNAGTCSTAYFATPAGPSTGGINPRSLVVGDFDGDGDADIAAANQTSATIRIILGNGNGGFSFAPGSPIPIAPGVYPAAIARGDFNGDGKADLATANALSNTVTILLGNGSGGFSLAPISPAVGSQPTSIVVADLNGDGIEDLAVGNYSDNSVTILIGDGGGGFSQAGGSPVSVGAYPAALVAADFNSDGKRDLALVNETLSGTLTLLVGDGSGGFSPAPGSPFNLGYYPKSLVAGDVNADGKLDVATADSSSGAVTVLLGNGLGSFTAAPGSPTSLGRYPVSIASGDFNGDGKIDLATANGQSNDLTILVGDGSGRFVQAAGSPVKSGQYPWGLATSDFNNDGKQDLATVNFYGGSAYIFLGTCVPPTTATLTSSPSSSVQGQSVAVTATITSPGGIPTGTVTFKDNGTALPGGSGLSLDGTGRATLNTTAISPGSRTLSVDYFGGGAFQNSSATSSQIVKLTTSTTLASSKNPSLAGQPVTFTATVNYASTGLVATSATSTVTFYDGITPMGTRTLSAGVASLTATGFTPGTRNISAVYAGDTLLVGGTSATLTQTISSLSPPAVSLSSSVNPATVGQSVTFSAVVRGSGPVPTGSVTFFDAGTALGSQGLSAGVAMLNTSSLSAGPHTLTAVYGGDASYGSGSTLLVQQMSAGSCSSAFFTKPGLSISTPSDPRSVAVGDFNGDGKQDFATANYFSGSLSVFLGNGTGNGAAGFTPAPGSTIYAGSDPTSLVVLDFNGDGAQDLAVTNYTMGTVSVFAGDGSGAFTRMGTGVIVGSGPTALATSDFNGDGRPDLVAANGLSNTVTILLGDGNGAFAPTSVSVGSYPLKVVVADFNNDGHQDLATANATSLDVSVLMGNGAGGFSQAGGSPVAATGSHMVSGDFNLDGAQDLVLAGGPASTLTVLRGNGSGGFVVGTPVTPANPPGGLVTADFNGDGKPDLAVLNQTIYQVTPFLGDGSGGFAAVPPSPAGSSTLAALAPGDFNGDGKQDLVVTSYGSDASILLGTCQASTFTSLASSLSPSNAGQSVQLTATVTSINGVPTGTVAFKDNGVTLPSGGSVSLNGSGVATLTTSAIGSGARTLTAEFSGSTNFAPSSATRSQTVKDITTTSLISSLNPSQLGESVTFTATVRYASSSLVATSATSTVLFTDGGATIGSPTVSNGVATFTTTGLFPGVHSIQATYVGNGLLVSSTSPAVNQTVSSLRPSRVHLFSTPASSVVGQSVTLKAAVTGYGGVPTGTVTFRDGGATLGSSALLGGVASFATSALPAGTHTLKVDYSGDGLFATGTGIAVHETGSNACAASFFAPATASPFAVSGSPQAVGRGDFNADGAQDLAVVNAGGNQVNILIGNGSGGFVQTTPVGVGSTPRSVSVADFNGDGRQDLAVANDNSNNLSVVLGDGSGGFTAAPGPAMAVGTKPVWVTTGDFNADGRPDLAVANSASNNVSVLLGNGIGGFTVASGSPVAVGSTPQSVAPGDFNGDGKLDLAVANFGNSVSILLGNGSGAFASAAGSPIAMAGNPNPKAVEAGDFNTDGILDLVVMRLSSSDLTVLLGNGSGGFVEASGSPIAVGSQPRSIALGDFNADGKVDFAVGNSVGNSVTVLVGNGAGGFTVAPGSPLPVGQSPQSVAVGDFNGDGKADLAVANLTGQSVDIFLGTCAAPTTTTVTATPSPSTFGQSVALTAAVTSPGGTPTGTVTFLDGVTVLGSATLSSGTATLSTTTLAVGTHSITASYAGVSGFAASTSSAASLSVGQAGTTTALFSNANPARLGQAVTLTAIISSPGGTPAGTLTFRDGTTTLGVVTFTAGEVTLTVSSLTVGAHSLTATYSGSASFSASTSSSLNQTVGKGLTTTTLSSAANPSGAGQSVTLTARVSSSAGTPSGSVTFMDGGTTLGSGTLAGGSATFVATGLASGVHTLTAVFAGTSDFESSTSASLTQTVSTALATTTTLATSLQPAPLGRAIILAVAVTAASGTPTGTVTFRDGDAVLATRALGSGTASFVTASLTAGQHLITVSYSGSDAYLASTSAVLTQTVSGTLPQLSVAGASVVEGNAGSTSVQFTVTLSSQSADAVTVAFATQDGTAEAGSDYTSASGSLTFTPGQTAQTVPVQVLGDTLVESNEGFSLVLTNATNATLLKATAAVAILNDDVAPEKTETKREQPTWQEFFAVDSLETPYVGDFNGDGRIDIITFTRQNPNAIGDVYVSLSDGAKFGANTKWHDFFAITTDEAVVIGDYNGDGKSDIATWLTKTSRQAYVALSTGNGMTPEAVWVDSIGKDATDLLLSGDANGDGKDDLIAFARKEGKVYVAISDGTKFATPTVWHGFFAVSTFERPRVADVNGDGKADIVTFATDSPTAFGDVYVATSDGTQFVGPTGAPNDSSKWHDFFAIRPTEEIRIGDLNGDGRDDFFTFLPPPFAQCYSVLSQGTSMAENALWAEAVAPLLGVGDNVYVGDVNGDGKADIVIFAQKEGKVFVSLAP